MRKPLRPVMVFAVLLIAGCGSKGPSEIVQSRPAPDATRIAQARECIRLATEILNASVKDAFIRDMATQQLAEAEARLGDIDAAKKQTEPLDKSVRADVLVHIAREQGLNGDLAGAQSTFQAARALIENDIGLSLLGTSQAAAGDLAGARQTIRALPGDASSTIRLALVESELKAGAVDAARDDMASLRKQLRSEPGARAWQGLVLNWYRLGDRATAEACIGDMTDRLDQVEAWSTLAYAEYEKGDTSEALTSAKRGLSIWPAYSGPINRRLQVRLHLAEVLGKCGDPATAKTLFDAAMDDVAKGNSDKVHAPNQTARYGLVAMIQRRGGDAAGAAQTMQLATARLPSLSDDETRALALWILASDQADAGDMMQAHALLDQERHFVISDSSDIWISLDLTDAIEGFTKDAIANDPSDLAWIERLPTASERAYAYATAALALGLVPTAPSTTAGSKP